MSEADYVAIEAAVTETVRGRWFLAEFARRNRTAEMRQLLDTMGRIEGIVSAGAGALPAADPSIRLLMQRVKDIAADLDLLAGEMRDVGVDERFAVAVEKEARAVSGMMRGPGIARPIAGSLPKPPSRVSPPDGEGAGERPSAGQAEPVVRSAAPVAAPRSVDATPPMSGETTHADLANRPPHDARLAILAPLDALPLAEKRAWFD